MRKVLKLLIMLSIFVGIYFVWPQPSLAASFKQLSPKDRVKAIGLYKVISHSDCIGKFNDNVPTATSWGTVISSGGKDFKVGKFVEEGGSVADNNGELYCSEALKLLAGLFGFTPTQFLTQVYEEKQAEGGTEIQQRRYQCVYDDPNGYFDEKKLGIKTGWVILPFPSSSEFNDAIIAAQEEKDYILQVALSKAYENQGFYTIGDATLLGPDRWDADMEGYCNNAISYYNNVGGSSTGISGATGNHGSMNVEEVSNSGGSGGIKFYIKGGSFSSKLTAFLQPYFNDLIVGGDFLVSAAPGGLLKALIINEYLFKRSDACLAQTFHPEEMDDDIPYYNDKYNHNKKAGKLMILAGDTITGLRDNSFNWALEGEMYDDGRYYDRADKYQIFPDMNMTCEEMVDEYSRLMEGYAVFNYPINKDIIDLLHKDTDTVPATDNPPVNPNEPVAGTAGESVCDVGILGWVVCPLVNLLASGADFFVGIIESQLAVKPGYFNFSPADGTYRAWGTFRDIANIIFVIMLFIVILSQITGIGISNYGIKKIIPKLVMVAILINVSYYVCLIAVDLSNIIGHQSKALLGGLVTSGSADNQIGNTFQDIGANAVLSGTVLIAGVAAFGVMGVTGIALGILTALISALFLFLILMIRQVAIILLVATSAIAIVCLLLPNTERFFERWRKIFVVMLVVYPVVGLVTGAGDLAKNIIFSADTGLIMKTVANLLPVLPAFIVPTLVKGTLNQFGTLGAKLSGLTDRAKAGASNRFKNSTLGNTLENQDRLRRLGRITNPNSIGNKWGRKFTGSKLMNGEFGRFTGLSGLAQGFAQAQARRQGAALHAEDKLEAENVAAAESRINEAGYQTEDQLRVAMVQAMQNNDNTSAVAYSNLLSARGGPGIAAVHRGLVEAQQAGANTEVVRRNIIQNHSKTYHDKDIETFRWAATGGTGNLETYARDNRDIGIGLSPQEIVDSSSQTLERLATAGTLNVDRLRELYKNDNLRNKLDGNQRRHLDAFLTANGFIVERNGKVRTNPVFNRNTPPNPSP